MGRILPFTYPLPTPPPPPAALAAAVSPARATEQPKTGRPRITRPTARGSSAYRGSLAWCGRTTARRSGPATRACDTCDGFLGKCFEDSSSSVGDETLRERKK